MGAMGRSFWFWMVGAMLLVMAGCGVVEGLKQSAFAEKLRAEKQMQSASQQREILGACQDATSLLAAAAKDSPEVSAVITVLQKGHDMAVEKTAEIEDAARKSIEWQSADAATVGPPVTPVVPDTPEEDKARTDFTASAQTISDMREGASSIAEKIAAMKRNLVSPPKQSDDASMPSGSGLIYGGLSLAGLLATGGIAGLFRKVSKVAQMVGQQSPSPSQTQEMESYRAEMKSRQEDADRQVRSLQEAVEQMRQMMSASKTEQHPTSPA